MSFPTVYRARSQTSFDSTGSDLRVDREIIKIRVMSQQKLESMKVTLHRPRLGREESLENVCQRNAVPRLQHTTRRQTEHLQGIKTSFVKKQKTAADESSLLSHVLTHAAAHASTGPTRAGLTCPHVS